MPTGKSAAKDLTGWVFGILRVDSRAPNTANGGTAWNCICRCGTVIVRTQAHLDRGAKNDRAQSCGCIKSASQRKANTGLNRSQWLRETE